MEHKKKKKKLVYWAGKPDPPSPQFFNVFLKKKKKKNFVWGAPPPRRPKPAFVSALWNGAKVPNGELGLSEPQYGTGVSETIGDYHIHLSSVLSLYSTCLL